jgi:hypothetical protein
MSLGKPRRDSAQFEADSREMPPGVKPHAALAHRARNRVDINATMVQG